MSTRQRCTSLLAVCLLAGCAAKPVPTSRTTVTLLPQQDGAPSAVLLNSGGASQVLSQPYQQSSAFANQVPRTDQASPADVQNRYAPLFVNAPPPSTRFVLFYQTGGTLLTADSQAEIGMVLRETLARSGAEILVVGHTDTVGNGDANDALALRRANQVRDLFVARGFAAKRLEAAGRGERELAVPTRDNVDEPRNRRVEVFVR